MAKDIEFKKEHVLLAAARIDREGVQNQSSGWEVLIEGRRYPPKEVRRFAHQAATGEDITGNFYGGDPTNERLKALGFEVVPKRRYWRVGTGHEGVDYWPDMSSGNYVAIGFPGIGDLATRGEVDAEAIKRLLKKADPDTSPQQRGKDAKQIYQFFAEMKVGDIVLAQDGARVKGVGEVAGSYQFVQSLPYPHTRPVEWRLQDPGFKNSKGVRTTVHKISDASKILEIEGHLGTSSENVRLNHDLNSILYGPPGTGKTYSTVDHALRVLGESVPESRDEARARFQGFVKEGRIVFTTFHQSMTYEDFVEGIKPLEPEEGEQVVYRVEPGIFRRLCTEAAFVYGEQGEATESRKVQDFLVAVDKLIETVESGSDSVTVTTRTGTEMFVEGLSSRGNLQVTHQNRNRFYAVSREGLLKLHRAFPDLSKVENFVPRFRAVVAGNESAYWAVLNEVRENYLQQGEGSTENHPYSLEEKQQVVSGLDEEAYRQNVNEPYVLIIDEINRGNVAEIFGELITLIEPDKRLGQSESTRVMLPYSKEWFGVPPNVHIIGTMNTADRGVEALDVALRRRFSFVEMPPQPELVRTEGAAKGSNGVVAGIDLAELLRTINRRLEKLLDKDHRIGHSYFLRVGSVEDLKLAFHHKIVPLLQEYFFGDYGKMGLVLGELFFDPEDPSADGGFFAPFGDYDASPWLDRKVFSLRKISDMGEEDFLQAIRGMMRMQGDE